MGVRAVALAILLIALGVNSSSATVRIANDRGGRIGTYIEAYAMLRSSGERVVIDGPCLSACTLIIGLIPRDRVCVTNRARLGFHAAWLPDRYGHPVRSSMGTQVLMEVYPPKVRQWIRHRGGLSRHMLYLRGRQLQAFYPRCR
jgi:hypothetical protein